MDWSVLREAGCDVRERVPLRDYTTFRLGGACPAIVNCREPAALAAAVRFLSASGRKYQLIGGGSNLLVADAGLDSVIVRYASETRRVTRSGSIIDVDGSTGLDDLAAFTAEQGLDGLVFASGSPGTVGGAVAGNAGAFGNQIGDRLVSATLMDAAGRLSEVKPGTLEFSYRHSRLSGSGEVLVSARLQLEPGNADSLRVERERILQLRRERHPDWRTQPTAGSFFRNIEPTSAAERRQAAGWFLERAGAKAMRVGGARVYEKHANIIVADAGATARDVLELSRLMADAVRRMFSIELAREVRLLGEFRARDESS